MKKLIQAFTIVELIVVITILAILSTIGFVSFSSHLVGIRDTNRLSQLSTMHEGLDVYSTQNELPTPENSVEVRASGSVIGYQGYAGKNVLGMIGYSKGGKDPKDEQYYSYYLTEDKKNFQLMAFLEDEGSKQNTFNIINQANAVDYKKRFPSVYGKKLGILTESGTNAPIQEVSSIVSSGYLDVVISTNTYTANLTDQEKVTGTGTKLVEKAVTISTSKGYKNCKEIYDNKAVTRLVNGTYTIKPEGAEIQAYCDMTTSSGANTLILDKTYSNLDNYLVGYWDMETLTSDYKLKDLSKYGNNGTCYNNTTSVNCGNSSEGPKIVDSNGTSGKAMSFDGLDDRIRINHDPNISFPGEITIYTKFYLDKICTTHVDGDPCLDTLVMKGGAFNPGFWLFANGYKKYYIEINGNNGGYLVISNQENKIGINTLVFTKKQDNNKYYINGLLDKEQTSNYLLLNNTDNLTIGTAMDTTNRVFDGLIDEVRIYNRVLTDNEIKMLYDLNK